MTLCLLLLFSMLVTLSAGALYYVSRTASEAYLYQQGLSSVYAAESGANVALGRLKTGMMGTDTSASRTEGTVTSTASDAEGGYKRTVRITYTSEEHEGQRIIAVTNVSS